MIFSKTSVSGTVEILAADEFTAIPITVDETSAVKAGTPMTSAGKRLPRPVLLLLRGCCCTMLTQP